MRNVALTTIAAVAVAFGCGDPTPSKYPVQPVYAEDTTLGPGDVFEVRVFRQEDMSTTYNVASDGTITFPLIGAVQVAGKKPTEVEDTLRNKLADGYLKNPQVSVFVKEYKSKKVTVFGEVKKPGTLAFAESMTVIQAIAQAGGFTNMARTNAVRVTRKIQDEKTEYTVPVKSIGTGSAKTFYMRPGDVVFVPRRVW